MKAVLLFEAANGLYWQFRATFQCRLPPSSLLIRAGLVRHTFFGKKFLCLYQSPATEWDSSDGLYGFFQRVEVWLRHAAVGELNPTGQPLHPPATMSVDTRDTIIPQADTPVLDLGQQPWIGFARLEDCGEGRFDLVEWIDALDETPPENAALAILLAEEMPYEYPKILGELLTQLEQRGISERLFGILLKWARQLQTNELSPLRIVVGTPMRGIAGGERRQHLTVWRIEPESAKLLGIAFYSFARLMNLRIMICVSVAKV